MSFIIYRLPKLGLCCFVDSTSLEIKSVIVQRDVATGTVHAFSIPVCVVVETLPRATYDRCMSDNRTEFAWTAERVWGNANDLSSSLTEHWKHLSSYLGSSRRIIVYVEP